MSDETTGNTLSNAGGNPLKRTRTDSAAATGVALDSCTRSPNFWHNEGSIILCVDDTLFRVHRDLLSTHFTVFKDVFTIPQPAAPEQLEGCQLMEQSGDRREDWETALTFMYSPLDINPWHNNLKSQQLLSLARLAHKYQGDKLLAECVNRLKVEFPTKLVEFQKLYPPHQIPSIINGRTTLAQNIHDFIALVNGALELDIECILPCAYYLLLVTFTPEDLTDLTIGADSTKAVLSPTAQRALLLGYSRIYPALLKSFQRWLLPEDTTWPWWCREEYEEVVYHWSMNPYDQGEKPQPPECRQDFDAIRLRIVQYLCHDHNCTPLLLSSCTQDEYYSDIFDGLCDSCRRKEREFRDMPQQEFWCTMPAVFGMGKAWKDLKYY